MATNKHDRIEKLLDVLGSGLYEKETAVKLGLLTALAGESMFMLGAPGCAKSMITRRIKEAFKADNKDGVKYFETLLNQFTTPEEVFGNISLKALNSDDLEAELSVGDVILNDGSIFSAKEIKNLSDEQKENVIAVVCISDESKYAVGVNQYSKKWTDMKQCCIDYSNKVTDDYSKGWIVPRIELLQKIWENRDVINKSLKAVNGETLDGKEYWSYSETEDKSAAKYMTFDDRGHQDHTTKDHEYTICVIRDWRNF